MAEISNSSSYDVFLSFRGFDTRIGFTGNLYNALTNKGINTFIDDEKLKSGEEITPALVKAIQESKIAITVLSINYAFSSFCLDELATIIDHKSKGMLVIPVFYEVDPSDVRHHKGSYGEALAKHEKRFQHKPEKLQKWKMALHQVSNLSGYHFKKGDVYEYKFTKSIIDRVLVEINHPARLSVPDHLVGLESKKAEIMKLLNVGSDDGIHIVGIHGMGGIGKSTLVRVVYNDLLAKKKFDGSCYLENVREESNRHGLKHLQSILLQELLGDKNINLASVCKGASMIEDRLRLKKVLLVLDDVDKDEQLKAIIGSPKWFGLGSRIIITTRNKQLLVAHEVQKTYEVNELDRNDALQLLTQKAFKNGKVDPIYGGVLNRVLAYASGLPLALEVIGAHLFGKSIEEWKSAINQYKGSPDKKIQNILEVSFDALRNVEKSVFLDIVCCFKGYELAEVEDVLHALYGYSMKYQIGVLVDKSLIKISEFFSDFRLVEVHDLIQDVGRQIEQEQSPKEPGKRRRLWLPKHIFEVLEDNTGTREIEIIYLDVPVADKGKTIEWDGIAFKKMKNLQILIIKNGQFSIGPKCLPNSLRVLEWRGYPSHCLPSDFHPENLAICRLPHSRLLSLEFGCSTKKFMNLTVLNFNWCEHLTRICDVSSCPNLEKLSFRECHNLVAVHESIGFLDRLRVLDADDCSKLENFPPIQSTSLRFLYLSHCSSLETFPEILGKMENINILNLSGTPIKKWPMSFQNLIGLQHLKLKGCGIGQLLSSIAISMLPRLRQITARDCKWDQWVEQEEDDEGNARSKVMYFDVQRCNLNDDFFATGFTRFDRIFELNLSGNNFTILPECIKEFQYLGWLDVSNCKHLQEIKGVPPNLRVFDARNCESLSCLLSRSMLIKQELYEAQRREFIIPGRHHVCKDECRIRRCILPGACVPEWFDQKSRGPSTSFWFRNNFPHKVLSLLIAPVDDKKRTNTLPIVFINGKVHEPRDQYYNKIVRTEMDHTYIFDLHEFYWRYDSLFREPLEKEWKHVEVTYAGVIDTSIIKATGIHLFKQESNNEEDIRFTDPHSYKRKSGCHLNSPESQIQPLLKKRRFAMPILKFHRYNLCMNGKKNRKMNQKRKKRKKNKKVVMEHH